MNAWLVTCLWALWPVLGTGIFWTDLHLWTHNEGVKGVIADKYWSILNLLICDIYIYLSAVFDTNFLGSRPPGTKMWKWTVFSKIFNKTRVRDKAIEALLANIYYLQLFPWNIATLLKENQFPKGKRLCTESVSNTAIKRLKETEIAKIY